MRDVKDDVTGGGWMLLGREWWKRGSGRVLVPQIPRKVFWFFLRAR